MLNLEKLLLQENLTKEESSLATRTILSGANPHQIAAFLMLMGSKGETVDELLGVIEEMQRQMVQVAVSCPVLDIVGTGGDGAHTLNISTASALLAASCGVKIAKHGNRSVSSLCGSADVLEALGINIDQTPEQVQRSIEEIGIGFMFAPHFHPALKNLKEIRRGLGIRTLFNIIAPLLNPARAEHLMLGVFSEDLLGTASSVLQRLQTRRSFVFHGCGLDELSCVGPSKVIEVTQEGMRAFVLDPTSFGLKRCSLEDLRGQGAEYNAEKILEALNGKESPFADTIALNAGVALYLYGKAGSIQEGIAIAQTQLKEKRAIDTLNKWRTGEASVAAVFPGSCLPHKHKTVMKSDKNTVSHPNYLTAILKRKETEIAELPPPVRFKEALKQERLAVIAEIKCKSPSKGSIRASIDPVHLAKQYVLGGAAAISVLTDEIGFGGSLQHLKAIIEACPGIPVLRKDFIIDIKQLYETARAGAHAVLLIAAALGDRLPEFIRVAKSYGLETLVEVHDDNELILAHIAGAEIIGVNNRNLATFEVSLETAIFLAPHFSSSIVSVAESGIKSIEDAALMRRAGYDAILVGEALVKAQHPQILIEEMRHAH